MLRLIVGLIFLLPSYAWAFSCVSTGAGDFDNPAIWTSCNSTYPQTGDDVTISHAVTIPAGTWSIGTNTATTQLNVADGGSIIFEAGATVNVTGFVSNEGTWDMSAGGSTLHFTNTTGNCPFVNGFNEYMGDANVRIGSSTASPRTTFTTAGCLLFFDQVTSSGTPQDWIIYNLDIDSTAGSTNTATVRLFDVDLSSGEGVINRFYMEGSTLICTYSCIYGGGLLRDNAQLTLKNNFFDVETVNASYPAVRFNAYNSPGTGAIRLIEGNTFDAFTYFQENRGVTVRNNIWTHKDASSYNIFTNSQNFAFVDFSGNIIRHWYGENQNTDATTYDSNYIICDDTAKTNPHHINIPTRNITTAAITNNVWEFAGNDNNGDSILIATPAAGPVTLNITNNLILPGPNNNAFGTLVSALGNANVTLNVNHNTVAVGCTAAGGDNVAGVVVGETYAGFAGMLNSGKSNIFWCNNSGPAAYKFQDANGTIANLALAASLDYNTGWNIAGAAALGYTGFNGSPAFGANDIDEDPDFVDRTRNALTFYAMCSGDGTPTYAELFAELKKKNDSRTTYDTCYDDLHTWVRAGFVPQNENLRDAGHDGITIGAMEMAALPTPTPTPTAVPKSGMTMGVW